MVFLQLRHIFLAPCLLSISAACPAGHACSSHLEDDGSSLVQRQARALQPPAAGTEFASFPHRAVSKKIAQTHIPQTPLERNVGLASNAADMMASDATSLVAELQALDLAIHHGSAVPPSLVVRGISSLETTDQDITRAPTTPPEASVNMSSQPIASTTNSSSSSSEHDVLPSSWSNFLTFGGRLPERSSIFVLTGFVAFLAIAMLGCYFAYPRPSAPTKPKLPSAMKSAAGNSASNTTLSETRKAALEKGWEYH